METQVVDDLTRLLRQTILAHQRQYGEFDRSEGGRQLEHHACLAVLQFLLLKGVAHDGEEHTVDTDGSLDDERSITLIALRVEVLDGPATVFLMLREVEIGAAVDALHLLESEWHAELHVCSGVGVMGKFVVVVEAIVLCSESQSLMPCHACLLPFLKPLQFGARLDEELHLHLLELPHAEDELPGHDFVAESLAYLCDAERYFHASRLLHVEVVDKDALSSFRSEIDFAGRIGDGTHLRGEHEVELPHIGPVLRAADGVDDFLVDDDLTEFIEVGTLHGCGETRMERVALGLQFRNSRAGLQELLLVEGVLEALAGFFHLLLYLLVILRHLVLDEHVGAITFLGVTVVDEWVVEGVDMPGSLPDGGMHEDGGVDADDVLVQQHHALPPIFLDVVFQFHTILAVVIDSGQTIINITAGEDEAIFLAMAYNLLEYIFLCHID